MTRVSLIVLAAACGAGPLVAQTRRPASTPAPAAAPAAAQRPAGSTHLLGGMALGYNAGRGADLSVTAVNLFKSFPLRPRLSLRYNAGNGGNAQGARHAFINDNTNGTPQDKSHTWGLKLDLLYPVGLLAGHNTQAYLGLRRAWFTGNYRLVGANEDFDVKSSPWGFGAGLETSYPVSRSVSISLTAGADYFFCSRMYGHDTAYTPSGSGQENPRAGFSYSDADAAVAQPKFTPVFMAGLQFRL